MGSDNDNEGMITLPVMACRALMTKPMCTLESIAEPLYCFEYTSRPMSNLPGNVMLVLFS